MELTDNISNPKTVIIIKEFSYNPPFNTLFVEVAMRNSFDPECNHLSFKYSILLGA